jgi:hypothetical protein
VSALALLYFFVDARYSNVFPRCPFFSITGLYCPGCGSQRALSSLLHGNILQVINLNVLIVTSIPFLMYSAYVTVLNVFRKEPVIQTLFYSPLFVKVLLVAVILFWIFRNIPVYPFTMLAPCLNCDL